VVVTEHVGHGRELAAAAAAAGARLVIAWGGDGTISEVASSLIGSNVALGIVPAGSGNGLARELGIARRPAAAIADAVRATPSPIDVGDVEGRYFVNTAGIGFDAHVASRFATASRRGFLGYVNVTARALASYVPLEYRISVDGRPAQIVRAVLVTIANSAQFGNGARIAPGAKVDDGELDLVTFEERSRFRTLCALPRLFNGTANRIAGCTTTRLQQVTISADAPLTFHVDGEPVLGGTTLRARVHPAALRVAVARNS
jgi:YegS/Rv2252/BmrU family lipid kinase